MASLPLKTVSELYERAKRQRDWWHNGGRDYSAYMYANGKFLLSRNGTVIFDYDPRSCTYAVAGSTPADRDAINSMLMILGLKDHVSNASGDITLANGSRLGTFQRKNAQQKRSKPASENRRPRHDSQGRTVSKQAKAGGRPSNKGARR